MHSTWSDIKFATVSTNDSHSLLFVIVRWDTAGAERFKGVTTNYFRGANG